jgi:hypothetical protein
MMLQYIVQYTADTVQTRILLKATDISVNREGERNDKWER